MTQEVKYARYHFKRFRGGKEMAEGASAQAQTHDEALKIVQGWYSYADSFSLHKISPAPSRYVPSDLSERGK